MTDDILNAQLERRRRDENYVLATVIETSGSASAKAGAKAVVDQAGTLVAGWVGGGCIEAAVCETALECLKEGMGRTIDVDLNDELFGIGMPCGGTMRIYLEPVLAQPRLWLLGHNQIAQAVCHLAAYLEFKVIIHDSLATFAMFPDADIIINNDLGLNQLRPRESDFAIITTQHKGDVETLRQLLATSIHYIALVASRHRAELLKQRLVDLGHSYNDISRVLAPAGLDLGATTPREIALAIVSDLVLTRRNASGERLNQTLPVQKLLVAHSHG